MKKLIMLETDIDNISPKDCIGKPFNTANGLKVLNDLEDIIKGNGYFGIKPVDFYLIAPDAEIKENDWYYFTKSKVHKHLGTLPLDKTKWDGDKCSKIIASTDKLVDDWDYKNDIPQGDYYNKFLPKLSESSIKLAIDYFNRTGKREVEVDVEEIHEKIVIYNFAMGLDEEVISKIKLNPEGKVDITIPENNTIPQNKRTIYPKHTRQQGDKLIIYGAGKFQEESLVVDKEQATLLLIDLLNFIDIK